MSTAAAAAAEDQEVDLLCNTCGFVAMSLSGLQRHRVYYNHDKSIRSGEVYQLGARKRRRSAIENTDEEEPDDEEDSSSDGIQEIAVEGFDEEAVDDEDFDEEEVDDDGDSSSDDEEDSRSEEVQVEDSEDDDDIEHEVYSEKFLQQQMKFAPSRLTPTEKACMQFASFSTSIGLSRIQVEALLKVLKSGLNVAFLPKTQRTLDKIIARTTMKTRVFSSGDDDGLEEHVIDVSKFNDHEPVVRFQFCDPVVAALDLLTSVYQQKDDKLRKLNWKYEEMHHPTTGEKMFKGVSCSDVLCCDCA